MGDVLWIDGRVKLPSLHSIFLNFTHIQVNIAEALFYVSSSSRSLPLYFHHHFTISSLHWVFLYSPIVHHLLQPLGLPAFSTFLSISHFLSLFNCPFSDLLFTLLLTDPHVQNPVPRNKINCSECSRERGQQQPIACNDDDDDDDEVRQTEATDRKAGLHPRQLLSQISSTPR